MNPQEYRRGNRNDNAITDKLTTTLFIIYLVALIWILLFKLGVPFSYTGTRSVNLIPFGEPVILNGKTDIGEMILNVVIFVPLGVYSGILFERWTAGKQLLFFFLISLAVEGLQYMLAVGASDITDIITNTSGGIIGLVLFTGLEKLFSNRVKAQQFINIVAAIGTILMISLLVLLKLNMLPVRYQ